MRARLVQFYYLSPEHVGPNRVLVVKDWHTHDRAELGLNWFKPGDANQLWSFTPRGDGHYIIVNKHSGKVLDDAESSRYPGCPVYQYSIHGGPNQDFRIKRVGDNRVQFFSRMGCNLVLDVGEHRTDDDARMVLWHDWKGPNQIWRLIPA